MDINRLLKFRSSNRIINKILELKFQKYGLYLPSKVKVGKNVIFSHNGVGTVIHPSTIIEDTVKIYQGVTIGRADIYENFEDSEFKQICIKKGAIICAGAKILSKDTLVVGENTIIAANSVLLNSTGDNEIWGGIPARLLKIRNVKKDDVK